MSTELHPASSAPSNPSRLSGPSDAQWSTTTDQSAGNGPLAAHGRNRWRERVPFGLLLVGTALLYLIGLSKSGWANQFYAAAAQAGSKNWTAFLFGSLDQSNFITVDKPPAFLWVIDISVKIFGVNSWSVLVPQALEGVAAVAVLYAAVKRVSGPNAALLAGAALATTPVATLMFRYDNPDALLVLLMTAAGYATVRAIEAARVRWLVFAGALLGFAFLTKMLQGWLVVPGFAAAYLVAAPTPVRRRLLHLLAGGAAMIVAAGWWIALVELWPAGSRPYIGGSTNNSVLELVFGYNGFGRLTGGSNNGNVMGGTGGFSSGETGLFRMFGTEMGSQISWLLPAALVGLGALIWLTWRRPRTDALRASVIVWGGWLLVTGLVLSFASGIIHPYYVVALAPGIAALVGIGVVQLWRARTSAGARWTLVALVVASAWWAVVLLDRASWHPELRWLVLGAGALSIVAILIVLRLRTRIAALVVAIPTVAALLVAPTAYSLQTASTAHDGAIPTAGPSDGFGGFGGFGGGRFGGGFGRGGRAGGFGGGSLGGGNANGGATTNGGFGGGSANGGATTNGGFGGGSANGTGTTNGGFGGGSANGAGTGGTNSGRGGRFGGMRGGFGGGRGGGVGGLGGASTVSTALKTALVKDASRYEWVAATTGDNEAATLELATGKSVMALGGYNGTDPAITLSAFEKLVRAGKVHYYIADQQGFIGSTAADTSTAYVIQQWVEKTFTARTIGTTTVYDLTART